jgi:hypothetical protein
MLIALTYAPEMNDMFAIDPAKRRIAAATSTADQTLRSKRVVSARFSVGLLAGAGLPPLPFIKSRERHPI